MEAIHFQVVLSVNAGHLIIFFLKRGRMGGFLVKRDHVFLFSVIRYYKKILSVNCE